MSSKEAIKDIVIGLQADIKDTNEKLTSAIDRVSVMVSEAFTKLGMCFHKLSDEVAKQEAILQLLQASFQEIQSKANSENSTENEEGEGEHEHVYNSFTEISEIGVRVNSYVMEAIQAMQGDDILRQLLGKMREDLVLANEIIPDDVIDLAAKHESDVRAILADIKMQLLDARAKILERTQEHVNQETLDDGDVDLF